MFKCIIFDFDGTLADTLPVFIRAFQRTVKPYIGRMLSQEEVTSLFGPTAEGSLKRFIKGDVTQQLAEFSKYYKEEQESCSEVFEGVREVLEYLQDKGVKLALVTGKGADNCAMSLKYYRLENFFVQVETGSISGDIKVENIAKVLKEQNLAPEDVLYVGDAASDIRASRANGIAVVSALWGSVTDEKSVRAEKPDHIFHTVSDFASYLGVPSVLKSSID